MKEIIPTPRVCKLSDTERHRRILCLGNSVLKRPMSTFIIRKCKGVANKYKEIKRWTGREVKHKTVVAIVVFDIMY